MKDLRNYSLKAHNTFGIEARCQRFLEFDNVDEARQVAGMLRASDLPYIIIGRGSNLLLTQDFSGTVVHSAITKAPELVVEKAGEVLVIVGSGYTWDDFVAYSVAHHWYGAENLSLIPGDVGAAAVQNIGAYGVEAKDLIAWVEAVRISDGQQVRLQADDCGYGYRQSHFKEAWRNQYLITQVCFRLSLSFVPHLDYGNIRSELERQGISEPSAQELRQTIIGIRKDKLPDPKEEGNAGSFFMNPVVSRQQFEQLLSCYPQMPHYYVDEDHEKIPAGWMIDQCGWKGRTMGRAGVHDKQALVLVNRGGATGSEVLRLCQAIRQDVKEKFGIDINPEVHII